MHKLLPIGLSEIFDSMNKLSYSSYPPSNLIADGSNYTIEVAVAGFKKSEISVKREGDKLSISGEIEDEDMLSSDTKFIHRGLSKRNFVLRYVVAKYVEVSSVKLDGGILTVKLKTELPESEKERIFEIL